MLSSVTPEAWWSRPRHAYLRQGRERTAQGLVHVDAIHPGRAAAVTETFLCGACSSSVQQHHCSTRTCCSCSRDACRCIFHDNAFSRQQLHCLSSSKKDIGCRLAVGHSTARDDGVKVRWLKPCGRQIRVNLCSIPTGGVEGSASASRCRGRYPSAAHMVWGADSAT